MRISIALAALFLLLLTPAAAAAQHGHAGIDAATPPEMVAAYDALADAILGSKNAETHLVHSILAATYRHAEAVARGAVSKVEAGQDAKADLEKLAALVSQLGNEGDASVAAIRKRLVEGGHHHHSSAEEQKIYDTGFVIVTKAAKKEFLAAAQEIGKMAGAPKLQALRENWEKVSKVYADLVKPYEK